MAAARLVPDRWAGVVADHVFAGHRVVLDVSFGTGRTRLGILARDGVLLRACHAAYSDGIAGLAQAAGPAAGLVIRVRPVAGPVADHAGDADRPPPAPRTRTTGRAPRGAQARPFGGLSPCPASSSKQT